MIPLVIEKSNTSVYFNFKDGGLSMKKISKLISLILCLSLLCSTVAFAAETKQATDSPNMKDILIDSTDDHFIVVSIPESEAESYQKRLESDPEFRENEIRQALGGTSADSRALPPGHIEYQSYMYRSDIKAAVDAASGSGTFDKWLTALGWTVSAADIAKIIKLSKKDNIFILTADILGTLVQWAQQEREAWWKEAYKDIINGTISAVRYTIVQNTTEYPKVWRVFERI